MPKAVIKKQPNEWGGPSTENVRQMQEDRRAVALEVEARKRLLLAPKRRDPVRPVDNWGGFIDNGTAAYVEQVQQDKRASAHVEALASYNSQRPAPAGDMQWSSQLRAPRRDKIVPQPEWEGFRHNDANADRERNPEAHALQERNRLLFYPKREQDLRPSITLDPPFDAVELPPSYGSAIRRAPPTQAHPGKRVLAPQGAIVAPWVTETGYGPVESYYQQTFGHTAGGEMAQMQHRQAQSSQHASRRGSGQSRASNASSFSFRDHTGEDALGQEVRRQSRSGARALMLRGNDIFGEGQAPADKPGKRMVHGGGAVGVSDPFNLGAPPSGYDSHKAGKRVSISNARNR